MRKPCRRFRVERLETRCLFAALNTGAPQASVATVSLEDAASIEVSQVTGLRGAALEISFDQKRLHVDPRGVRAGSAWGGKGMSIANVDNEEGTINVFVFSAHETDHGHGSLVEIDFQRSDNDRDGMSPQIDVNRLSVNDSDVTFVDSDADRTLNQDLQASPKLSLQFNIAAEGESSPATNYQYDDAPPTNATDVDTSPTPKSSLNHGDNLVYAVQDRQSEDANEAEPSKDDDLPLLVACRPGDIDLKNVTFVNHQGAANLTGFTGPVQPPLEEALVSYAPSLSSYNSQRESMPLLVTRNAAIVKWPGSVADFSQANAQSSLRLPTLKTDFESDEPSTAKLQQLDRWFASLAF